MVDARIRDAIRLRASRKVVWARRSFFLCLAAFVLNSTWWVFLIWLPSPGDPDDPPTPTPADFVEGFIVMLLYLPGLLFGLVGAVTLGFAIREAPQGRKMGKVLAGTFLLLPSLGPFVLYIVLIIVMVTTSR